jgi:hypothetical protein
MGSLPFHNLKFETIFLLKKYRCKIIRQYRPVCLLNVSFKFFIKVNINKDTNIINRITKPSKITFLLGKYHGRCSDSFKLINFEKA